MVSGQRVRTLGLFPSVFLSMWIGDAGLLSTHSGAFFARETACSVMLAEVASHPQTVWNQGKVSAKFWRRSSCPCAFWLARELLHHFLCPTVYTSSIVRLWRFQMPSILPALAFDSNNGFWTEGSDTWVVSKCFFKHVDWWRRSTKHTLWCFLCKRNCMQCDVGRSR